jgi:hypothetical protein
MRFKANHSQAVGGRNVYLRNRRDQIARQPAKIMISLVINLRDAGFLLEIGYIRNLVVRHLDHDRSCRRRSGQSVALHPRVTLVAIVGGLGGDRRILVNFTGHGERERSGSGAESSKCEAVKYWKAREWE